MSNFKTDFLPIPFIAIQDKDLTETSRFILGLVYYICEKRGEKFFMGNDYIAQILNIKPNTVTNCLLTLENKGYIKRIYNEDNTKRLEIKCLVQLVVVPSDKGDLPSDKGVVPSDDVHNKIPNKINKREYSKEKESKDSLTTVSKKEKEKVVDSAQPFVWRDYLNNLLQSKRPELRMIAYFMGRKKMAMSSKAEVNAVIKRYIRVAKDVAVFTPDKIKKAYDDIEADEGLADKYTLETVYKYLTK